MSEGRRVVAVVGFTAAGERYVLKVVRGRGVVFLGFPSGFACEDAYLRSSVGVPGMPG